ncbi:hypothetical protein [Psychrilyobacter atlanticus]|uniref:hypothetical protein n=1 Tax=Psychrilyobacter atlanticus TaxID=271091 RepID=UPI0003FBB0D9|nr:hypothetical protein [Psychrilyobacter atlanticus]
MEYTARVKINLKEVKLIEELLKIEINKNKLTIESHNLIEYNEVLKRLLKKIQMGQIHILEDILEHSEENK